MRIAITGASGNFGTALLRALAADEGGPHEIIGVSRRVPPEQPPYAGVRWVSTDISHSSSTAALTEAFAGADAVVHLAWLIQPSYDRELLRRTNQGGTARVIEAVRQAGVGQLVHASSIGTYSPAPDHREVGEDWPHEGVPGSAYSVDKAAAEALLDDLEAEQDGADPAIVVSRVRPGLILQPGAASEIARYFLPGFLPTGLVHRSMLRVAPFPAAFSLQFVHADDVARAVVLVLKNRAGGAFNVATEPPVDRQRWRQLFGGVAPSIPAAVLRTVVRFSWAAHLQPVDPGWIDLAANLPTMRCDRIRELGWHPTKTAEQVLREFVEALRRGEGTASPALAPRGQG